MNSSTSSQKHDSMRNSRGKLPLEEIDEIDELITSEYQDYSTESDSSRRGSCRSIGSKRLISKVLSQNKVTKRRRFDSADYFLDAAVEDEDADAPTQSIGEITASMEFAPLEVAPWMAAPTKKGFQPKDWIKERSKSYEGFNLMPLECRLEAHNPNFN